MDLACHYAGVAGAAEVAERQATHTGDVGRYVHDVCSRYDAFRGAVAPLRDVYATAVGTACDGLDRSGRAARRWGGAARDTAADLADVDALARRVVEKLAELLPGVPDDLLPVAPVAADVAPGAALTSSVPTALTGSDGGPVPLDRVLGVDTRYSEVLGLLGDPAAPSQDVEDDGTADDPGDADDSSGPGDSGDPGGSGGSDDEVVDTTDDSAPWRRGPAGPYAEALGAGVDLRNAVDDAVGAAERLGTEMAEGADARDDAASYDDFVAEHGDAS